MSFCKSSGAAIIIVLTFACSSQPKCTIKGIVTDQVDSAFLLDHSGNRLDAGAVQNGTFALACDMDPTIGVSISLGEDREPVLLIPDSKEILVKIEDGVASISGSPLSEELHGFQQWIMNHFMSYNEKAMARMDSGDQEGADALMQEMHNAMADHCKDVYLNHLQDPVGSQAMALLAHDVPEEEFIRLYEMGGKCIHEDAMIAGRYESLTANLGTVIQLDSDGSFTESKGNWDSFIGKGNYVLVDFWASWCGPCRKETPYVVKAYNDYKDKGLVVLGIPVQDKLEATKKAMKDLGIHYPQLLDPQTVLAKKYGVTGIPHLFLFSPDGNIVKEGMRESGIDAVLKTVFKD